jgi:hypothetical protein
VAVEVHDELLHHVRHGLVRLGHRGGVRHGEREVVDGAKNLEEKGPDACVAARVEEGEGSRARVGLSIQPPKEKP